LKGQLIWAAFLVFAAPFRFTGGFELYLIDSSFYNFKTPGETRMSRKFRTLVVSTLTLVYFISFSIFAAAQAVDKSMYQSMRWRMIGPFRAGRTVGAAGIPSQPNVFYIGVNNGGVWKTTDAGRTWQPIFDDQPRVRSVILRSRRLTRM